MTIPEEPSTAIDLLSRVNGNPYRIPENPYGMAKGGHKVRWTPAANAIAAVSNWVSSVVSWMSATASQVAADAASAAEGSGTEATVTNIRSGLTAMYLSIRRIYAANDPVALTDAASIAWDMSAGINFKMTLGAAGRALANPSNQVAGKSGIVIFTQNGSGTGTITSYGANIVWIGGQPDWPTTPGAKVVVAYFVEANGTVLMSPAGASA